MAVVANADFLLRIVTTDIATAPPVPGEDIEWCTFAARAVRQSPVIRLFGSTHAGQKVAAHVHNVFPYFFLDLPQDDSDKFSTREKVLAFIQRLAASIERAMDIALTNKSMDGQYIHDIQIVKGRPFYGFSFGESFYFKVYIYNPFHLTRMVNLLRSGAIMQTQFQAFEAHIPYLLQLFVDYNLFGMAFVKFSAVRFRQPLPAKKKRLWRSIELNAPHLPGDPSQSQQRRELYKEWTAETIPAAQTSALNKDTPCELEIDVSEKDILNVEEIQKSPNDSTSEEGTKLVRSLAEIWEDERSRRQRDGDYEWNMDAFLELSDEGRKLPTPSSLQVDLLTKLRQVITKEADYIAQNPQEAHVFKDLTETVQRSSQAGGLSQRPFADLSLLQVSDEAADMLQSTPAANLNLSQLQNYSSVHHSTQSQVYSPAASQSLAEINAEMILSQSSDNEALENLNWMKDDPPAADDELDEEDRSSQQECVDILESQKMVRKAVKESPDEAQAKASAAASRPGNPLPQFRPSSTGLNLAYDDPSEDSTSSSKSISESYFFGIPSDGSLESSSSSDLFGGQNKGNNSPIVLATPVGAPSERLVAATPALEASGFSAFSAFSAFSIPDSHPLGLTQIATPIKKDPVTNGFSLPGPANRKRKRGEVKVKEEEIDVKFDHPLLAPPPLKSALKSIDSLLHNTVGRKSEHKHKSKRRKQTEPAEPTLAALPRPAQPQAPGELLADDIEDFHTQYSNTEGIAEDIIRSPAERAVGRGKSRLTANPSAVAISKLPHPATAGHSKQNAPNRPTAQRVSALPKQSGLPAAVDFAKPAPLPAKVSPKKKVSFVETVSVYHIAEDNALVSVEERPVPQPTPPTPPEPAVQILGGISPPPPKDASISSGSGDDPPNSSAESDSPEHLSMEQAMRHRQTMANLFSFAAPSPSLAHSQPILASHLIKPLLGAPPSPMVMPPPPPALGRSSGPIGLRTWGTDWDQIVAQAEEYHSPFSTQLPTGRSGPVAPTPAKSRPVGSVSSESYPSVADQITPALRRPSPTETSHQPHQQMELVEIAPSPEGDLPMAVKAQNSGGRPPSDQHTAASSPLQRTELFAPSPTGSIHAEAIAQTSPHPWDGASTAHDRTANGNAPPALDGEDFMDDQVDFREENLVDDRLETRAECFAANGGRVFSFRRSPPTVREAEMQLYAADQRPYTYLAPFYSDQTDWKGRLREFAGQRLDHISTDSLAHLPKFDGHRVYEILGQTEKQLEAPARRILTPALAPPEPTDLYQEEKMDLEVSQSSSSKETSSPKKWMGRGSAILSTPMGPMSQIEMPTPPNAFGYILSPEFHQRSLSAQLTPQGVTTLSIEFHAQTRGELRPDPQQDAVGTIYMAIRDDSALASAGAFYKDLLLVLRVDAGQTAAEKEGQEVELRFSQMPGVVCLERKFSTELQLFAGLVECIAEFDPDLIVGYEVQSASFGFLIERAKHIHFDLMDQAARSKSRSSYFDREKDSYGFAHSSGIHLAGRSVLNLWRLLRSEIKTTSYTFENTTFHILHQRTSHAPYKTLTRWYSSTHTQWRTHCYYLERVQGSLYLMDALNLVGRTGEMARLYGITFFEVLSRGSQFRVESLVLRLAKRRNFLLFAPSKQQVSNQFAPECIPLVMEPRSNFYTDPLLVLDFQSLYPSITIAYNYCYSTCLGRVQEGVGKNNSKRFGCHTLNLPRGLLQHLEPFIHVAPNEVMFLKPDVQIGLFPRLLVEILETRVMVKESMKRAKADKAVYTRLDARQLGLKLLANVTYGYTSASFSGRMPCVEIADAIVQTARETLERAIHMVNTNKKWQAKVVYGDTDSLFVLLHGASRERAFDIGQEIAEAVTAANPWPVKLKFEKLYHPCLLLAKKRYVGHKYENKDQSHPVFDAKGIETIRRDSCPVVSKILEKTITMLFEKRDLSAIKTYTQRQFKKIYSGRVPLSEFIFRKEVRLGTYSAKTVPPAALVATKEMAKDPRAEPKYGERVPYIVAAGHHKSRLIDLVYHPDYFSRPHLDLRPHSTYYITKQIIPAMDRIFNLVGVDVKGWFTGMPAKAIRHLKMLASSPIKTGIKARIDQYYLSQHCPICDGLAKSGLCADCAKNKQAAAFILISRMRMLQGQLHHLNEICMQCENTRQPTIECDSLDCLVYFERTKAATGAAVVGSYLKALD